MHRVDTDGCTGWINRRDGLSWHIAAAARIQLAGYRTVGGTERPRNWGRSIVDGILLLTTPAALDLPSASLATLLSR
jgi:hypothetical protein